jgi:glycosyltransferase involved in cell wall biosynthesis
MQILFVHQNYPAQFGHIAARLAADHGHQCVFLSLRPAGVTDGVRRIQYKVIGGATRKTHYCSRTFENAVAHGHGAYEAMKRHPDVRPDLIVAHSGLGSGLFLSELYDCPVVNYFEYFYHPHGSDMDFRHEFPPTELDILRARARNATILLDLDNCDAGYSPTHWQAGLLPAEYRDKVRVIFDGIDTDLYKPDPTAREEVLSALGLSAETKLVTYVSRTFEAMRGFDIFMEVADRVAREVPEAVFLAIGGEGQGYGGDARYIEEKSFREHVLKNGDYPLSKIRFTGRVPPQKLAHLLAASDLHLYFTVPFVLSWSLLNAMACGCRVVASDTAPVQEVIRHGENGLLAGFYDIEGLAGQAVDVLKKPGDHEGLGQAAARMVGETYSLDVCLPALASFYEEAASKRA